ncbi:MAG TPA: hypothetical protein VGL91_05810, partial [Acidobacteriota bacterium]
YKTDGTLDTTFGTSGKVTTDFSVTDEATAIAIQLDGKIVAAGFAAPGSSMDFALARYNTNGRLDTTFGIAGTGKVTTDFSGREDEAFAIAIQSDGKILLAGSTAPFNKIGSAPDFALARYEGLTPQDLATALGDQVQALVKTGTLNQGQGNSLTTKLAQILDSLNQGKTKTACNQLQAFINEVNSLVSEGVLPSGQAQPLIDAATNIRNTLGC